MSDLVLELRDVSKAYNTGKPNEVRVLERYNLSLAQGEVVALVAPSGAGKSTLLHIAGLLDTAQSGDVVFCGRAMSTASDSLRTKTRRQGIGFVYQFHHLLPEFSALENCVLPQLANGISPKEARSYAQGLLDKVGLSHRLNHRPAEMSGGEQQRAAFCRAMANRPKLLLADEPTGNLDPATSETVFDMLKDLVATTGLTALVATHNHALAQKMDRVIGMGGKA
ncbi:MAG: ABC transporter ATP-binding protein [Paracoccaceae bacterium]|jgi:lipoprotein-releasing system ATP-binding protein